MALFGKNANESAYVGGKKHWVDIIKNTGPGDLLVWRQPEEDFNTNSTLIVMPGEEAIFIKGGSVEQVFDAGDYKLSTENYPVVSRLRNAFSGGISTFNCVVYFVRKSHSVELLWGTASPLKVRDKLLGIQTQVYARGSYKVSVENSAKLLNKLLGNNINVLVQQELDNYFSNEFQSKIRSFLTRALNETETELLGIESHLDEFSELITPALEPIIEGYGLTLENFNIAALEIEDLEGNELRQRYEELQIKQRETIQIAQAEATARRLEAQSEADAKVYDYQAEQTGFGLLGNDWSKLKSAEILNTLAGNEGTAGGVAATGAGLGMGMAAGSVFAGLANNMFSPLQQQTQPTTPQPSGRFAPKTAHPPESPSPNAPAGDNDPVGTLKKLKDMLDMGLIAQDVYDAKKAEILSRM